METPHQSASSTKDQWLEKKILIVGDSRAREYGNMAAVDMHPSIKLLFKEEATLQYIFEMVNEYLEPSFDILIIIGILHDLVEMKINCDKKTMKPVKCDIYSLIKDIELYTRIWKMLFPNLCIIWTYPSIPDFDRFNISQERLTVLEAQLFSISYMKLKNIWAPYMTGFPLYELNQTTFPQRAFKHYYTDFAKSGTFPKFKEDLTTDGLHPSVTATIKFWNKLKNFYTMSLNLYNSAFGLESTSKYSCPECPTDNYDELKHNHIFVCEKPKIREFSIGSPIVLDTTVKTEGNETMTEELLQENFIEITHPVSKRI